MPSYPYDEAASTPAYRSAYDKAMGGAADELTEEERAAVAEVRRLAGTAVGYPAPPDPPSAPSEPAPQIYRVD